MNSTRSIVANGALWRELTPLLPALVKQVNMGSFQRFAPPLPSKVSPQRHFLVNDTAYYIAADQIYGRTVDISKTFAAIAEKWKERLANSESINETPSRLESTETLLLARRLVVALKPYTDPSITFSVKLPAFGRLESVDIDVLSDTIIGECKAGDRPFRSVDFRQLILAAAAIGESSRTRHLLLINAREGKLWHSATEEFIQSVSLCNFSEFLYRVRFELSDLGLSI